MPNELQDPWHAEKTAAFLSAAVAAAEVDPVKAKLFQQMADAAEEQAAILAKGLKSEPDFEPPARARIVAWLIGVLGPRAIRPVEGGGKFGQSHRPPELHQAATCHRPLARYGAI